MIANLLKILNQWPLFVSGLGITLALAAVTVVLGTLLGAIVALIKISQVKWLNAIISVYVELIRGTPLLLQLYFFYYLLPDVLGLDLSKATCIIIALVVNSSAYVAEIIRAGIQAVDKGQREAAKSLGMTDYNCMRRIILPQAFKNILPALGNEFIMMVKETSLASTFFIGDLMTQSKIIASSYFLTIEPLMIVAAIYFTVTFTLSKVVAHLEWRLKVSD